MLRSPKERLFSELKRIAKQHGEIISANVVQLPIGFKMQRLVSLTAVNYIKVHQFLKELERRGVVRKDDQHWLVNKTFLEE